MNIQHSKLLPPHLVNGIKNAILKYQTPFYIYDERGIKNNTMEFLNAFAWDRHFKEFFAVKALPNPCILKLLKQEGLGVDCSSMAELVLAQKSGFCGEEIIFTSNNTPLEDYAKALELGAIINLDDITHIDFLRKNLHLPDLLCFRYNPGEFKYANAIIGDPKNTKFGLTKEQLFTAYQTALDCGVKRFGLHTMVASNELDPECFTHNAREIFSLASQIMDKLGIVFEFINLGGGLGIPYMPHEQALDIKQIAHKIKDIHQEIFNNTSKPSLAMENGRYITGPYGFLVSRVLHLKTTYKDFVGLDATMADLMRPGMYGTYHHISVLDKEHINTNNYLYDVVGSLCENNDKFAIDRILPPVEVGDIIVIHDAGAHAHAMGFNYNGKLRSAELLLTRTDNLQLIRRAETLDDYFATLAFETLG